MKAGSMEGLIGASVNVGIAKTPLRVYKEAERKGDTATMERSMGYFNEFSGKAARYAEKAAEATQKEQKEERREQELERERAIEEKRAETRAERENALEAATEKPENGKVGESADAEAAKNTEAANETMSEPVPLVYTDSGAILPITEPVPTLDAKA